VRSKLAPALGKGFWS